MVEPTEGWVSVSSPVREKESEEVKMASLFSPAAGFLQVTLWDLVKEGSLEQLTVVLDNLKEQVGRLHSTITKEHGDHSSSFRLTLNFQNRWSFSVWSTLRDSLSCIGQLIGARFYDLHLAS